MDMRISEAAKKLARHDERRKPLEAELVAALRASQVSAKQIAEEIGISEQYLSDLKNKRRSISNELVRRIMESPC